ncbi:Chitobiase/beta-hexosaminidase C-terminal domain-containing protein [Leifsonia sp. 98AMF]|uniref:FN3 associated domain-containing protein n=1 Tax=unclassified Leifsonia TaxID=2663824 RepID=UPI000879F60C|nr:MULTISPECIES: FN3 associated domain-containing protein [unclassified Leifsonia]SDH06921.1 Chitobiase/beta-hexosaminidase C-terminal domain-containing protein [Leifsonia sp. 197AMF]SDJ33333.1 Chitobiase/beta-hexosaminidase C-terminal domain-containing protein [Leifsonia sp. 466MF]SDK46603.1 Chitobiase/beta-hexosaminidase C-terminal domain-containing protein [Leifsonia sp. 157MF]SDN54272.1 Chitobiase/beta-hexosaminidase C-terminal domain-containing protein [Leifsonia sp. 509MF]SEN55780.1 Chit
MKKHPLYLLASTAAAGALLIASSAQAFAHTNPPTLPTARSAAATPSECPATTPNPTTDNVKDYQLASNTIGPGRWSYEALSDTGATLLQKGGSGAFAADEWALDLTKPEHAWYVKADGSIGTDWRPIAQTYTVPDEADGKPVHLTGSFTSLGGRFRILLAHDGDSAAIAGSLQELFTYTGTSTNFDKTFTAAKGDDILFVSDSVQTWWVPGKLQADITSEVNQPAAPVTSSPAPGTIDVSTPVTLTTKTAGACIRYTTDGSDPATSATAITYTKPVPITADTDLKAVAIGVGGAPSTVSDLPFVLNEPFRAFAGVNQGPTSAANVADMQWGRQDFDWGTIEPEKGKIDHAALDKYVQQFTDAKAHGVTILPVLAYTAGWAANRTGYSYEFHGKTYQYGPVTGTEGWNFIRQLKVTDSSGKVISDASVQTNIGRTPPQDPKDWADFVKLAVDTLKPLGITYFQVWNEAYPGSGFWEGGMDQYMQDIQLPAAKIIHAAGMKVVYGGWICGAPLSEYIALLDKWKAWKSIDVYDMHYMPIGTMQTIYAAAQKRGIKNPSVWQTEIGFTTEDKFIADIYPRVFHWALSKGGSNPDQVKLIYFADWSPNDPAAFGYNRTIKSGDGLSTKGKTLVTLADLLRGSKATTYDSFTTDPGLKPELNEALSTANGFLLDGKRIVLAIDLKRQNQADIFEDQNTGDTIHLDFGEPTITVTLRNVHNVKSLDRVDLLGNRTPLTWTSAGRNAIQVQVPIRDTDPTVHDLNQTENEDVFYLSVNQG